ncbi:MAG: ABC transporter substrate-binding protein [Magnetococcales bacterium]|nr:ABC transporter substrate-binding protein [Magnetococcales bacterium]NGZ25568.1 ABC transporter substrate-binding protein [Magnetococcales bacterium]
MMERLVHSVEQAVVRCFSGTVRPVPGVLPREPDACTAKCSAMAYQASMAIESTGCWWPVQLNQKWRHLFQGLFSCLMFLFLLPGCEQSQDFSQLPGVIRFASTESDAGSLALIANNRGFFKQNGLDVDFRNYTSGKEAMDVLLAGESDLALVSDFVFVRQLSSSSDLKIIASIATLQTVRLYARKDRGIDRPEKLIDRRIGVTLGSTGEFFLSRYLASNGIPWERVILKNLSPSTMVEMLTKGEIDAAIAWQPFGYQIRQNLGDQVMEWPAQESQGFHFIVIAKGTWLENHARHAKRVLLALFQAETWLGKNLVEARFLIGDLIKATPSYMNDVWDPAMYRMNLSQSLIAMMVAQKHWGISQGILEENGLTNYRDHLWLKGLEEVKPNAISIIR